MACTAVTGALAEPVRGASLMAECDWDEWERVGSEEKGSSPSYCLAVWLGKMLEGGRGGNGSLL